MMKFNWKCPLCKSVGDFKCQCEGGAKDKNHGLYISTKCTDAFCQSCGWHGKFPDLSYVHRFEDFTENLEKFNKTGSEDAKIRMQVIMHEWLAQCLEVFLENRKSQLIAKEFTNSVLIPIWCFMGMHRNDYD